MSTRYTFTDDSDDVRLSGFLTPDPGGSSPHIYTFPFAFDTAGLEAGVTVYTPAIGEILLDAWIQVDTAFDGTTPHADLGQFVGVNVGFYSAFAFVTIALDAADEEAAGPGYLGGPGSSYTLAFLTRAAPGKFTSTAPLKLVVSQTGEKGGGAIGGAAGSAVLYLRIATSSASPG